MIEDSISSVVIACAVAASLATDESATTSSEDCVVSSLDAVVSSLDASESASADALLEDVLSDSTTFKEALSDDIEEDALSSLDDVSSEYIPNAESTLSQATNDKANKEMPTNEYTFFMLLPPSYLITILSYQINLQACHVVRMQSVNYSLYTRLHSSNIWPASTLLV